MKHNVKRQINIYLNMKIYLQIIGERFNSLEEGAIQLNLSQNELYRFSIIELN